MPATPLPSPAKRRAVAFAVGMLTLAACLGLRWALRPFLSAFFVVFVPPMFLAAWRGGLLPGLATTAVCCALSAWELEPGGSFAVGRMDDVVGLVFLSLTGVLASVLSEHLFRTQLRLEDALSSRDVLISTVSHELKNPLNALQLQVTRLTRKAAIADEPDAADALGVARQQIRKLVRLIDDLLDSSRVGSHGLELAPEDLDLSELVRDVAKRERGDLAAAGCELELAIDDGIRGRFDRLRLDQVVTNLLVNAAKYGQHRPVSVRVERAGERARIVVHDRGRGIAPADQARIFDRFERAVSDRDVGGFGLGLWIARAIVEASQGSIRVESAPGEGATFTVDLPLDGRGT